MVVEQNNIVSGENASASEAREERVFPENEIRHTRTSSDSLQQNTQYAPSPPRRPKTRSQSGITVPKRRPRDDSPLTKKRRVVKPTDSKSRSKGTYETGEASESQEPEGTEQPAPSAERRLSCDPSESREEIPTMAPERHAQAEEDSPAPSLGGERRGPRSRVILPVPVPNLTKKSRGRRVPTKHVGDVGQSEQETRSYVCTAEGCGKCFHRGEHLKRHIRSIHTHEKPFKCTYPMCEKHFNRHDNLLQHLKVHKDPVAQDLEGILNNFSSSDHTESPPVSPVPNNRPIFRVPVNQPKISTAVYDRTVRYNPYPTPVTYHTISEPVSFAASIAVSSLRTEIPQSP